MEPLFVNPDVNDYRLAVNSNNSLLINHGGSWLAVGEKDIDGQPRRIGSSVDMGADEVTLLTVDAGQDRRIKINESPVALNDSNAVDNGWPNTPASNLWRYQWRIIAGPNDGATFTDTDGDTSPLLHPSFATTKAGTYSLEMVVYVDSNSTGFYETTDDLLGMDTVNITLLTSVYAGPDQFISLPTNTTTLSGKKAGVHHTEWAFYGEEDVTFSAASSLETTVTFPNNIIANYVLYLLGYDEYGRVVAYDSVCVYVSNRDIWVEAGDYKETVWPDNDVALNDAWIYARDMNNVSTRWFGGAGVSFDPNDSVVNATAGFTSQNIYQLGLFAYIAGEAVAYDTVWVKVKFADTDPNVEAGGRKVGRLDANGLFVCSLNDAFIVDDGELNPPYITSVLWSASGPNSVSFANANAVNTAATFTQAGIYTLTLTATLETETFYDTVTVVVFDAEHGIFVNAGSDKTIELADDPNYQNGTATAYLSDAQILLQAAGIFDVNWTVDGPEIGDVEINTDGSDGIGSIVKPTMRFHGPGVYTVTLTVEPNDPASPWPPDTDIAYITVLQDGQPDDTVPPVIDDFYPVWNGVPVEANAQIYGDVTVKVKTTDVGGGIARIELRWNDANDQLIDEINGDPVYPNQLQLEHMFMNLPLSGTIKYTLFTKATDRKGNFATQHLSFWIREPNTVADPPVARITNDIFYENEQPKTNPLPVLNGRTFTLAGSAYHPAFPNDNVLYKVDLYKPPVNTVLNPEDWIYVNNDGEVIATRPEDFVKTSLDWQEGRIVNGVIGNLDLSDVEPGPYQILLTVANYDQYSRLVYSCANVGFVLEAPANVGNIKFSQEDLAIPAGSATLRVVRIYDSFSKNKDGDFGYGWSYSIANMDIHLDEDRYDGFYLRDISGNEVSRSMRNGSNVNRNVTLTLPDGQRATFLFYLDREDNFSYIARYISPPGVHATLETAEEEKLMLLPFPYWYNQSPGFIGGVTDPANYDFSGYRLTTEDGTTYNIDRKSYNNEFYWLDDKLLFTQIYGPPYLASIETPTGEEIDFNVNSSTLGLGDIEFKDKTGTVKKAVEIEYAGGRISEIRAPSENGEPNATLKYEYDEFGNLIKVRKLVSKNPLSYETTTYVYEDASHNAESHFVTEIKDARGLSPIVYIYDPNGYLIGIRDAKGKEIAITHDVTGRTEASTDRSGNTTIYWYNERGNVTQVMNALGQTMLYEYGDPNTGSPGDAGYEPRNPDKVTAVKVPLFVNPVSDANYSITRTTYDDKGRVDTVTDPEGNRTENSYSNDIYGNLLTVAHKKPDGSEVSTTRNTYTANLLKTTRVTQGADMNIYAMTVNLYDTSNRLTNTVNVELAYISNVNALYTLGSIGSLENAGKHSITSYEYDEALSGSFDQPYKVTDAAGFERYFEYDDNGALIETRTYTNNNTDLPRTKTETLYDSAGRVLESRRQVGSGQATVLGETAYNSIGRVDASINEVDTSTEYTYDQMGNLVETRVYDSTDTLLTQARTLYDRNGRVLVSVDAHDANGSTALTAGGSENVYDELGRIIETRRWSDVDVNLVDLDVNGVRVGLKVPDGVEPNNAQVSGGAANIGWTSNGVLPRVNTANMLSYTRTEYDVGGRVWKVYTLDKDKVEHVTTYGYDKAGKQISVTDDLNNSTETYYLGTMREHVTDARNNTTYFTYDALGRVIKTTYPATTENPVTYVHTQYDSLGRKVFESEQTADSAVTGTTIGKTFEYDSSGNLIKVTLPQVPNPDNGNQLTNPEFRYVYDIYGNSIAQIDPNSQITIFTYNELDLQTHKYEPFEITGTLPTTAAQVYAISLAGRKYEETAYDDLGRVRTVKDYKGQVKILDYNICGWLEFVRYYVNWATLSSNYPANGEPNMQYTYDALGRKDKIYRNSVEVQDFDYDIEGRIIAIDTPQGSIGYKYNAITGRKTFVYEPADNFANAANKIEYAYDALGRLSDVNIVRINNYANLYWGPIRYSYNEVGAVETIRHPNGNYVEYTYDDNGSCITKTVKDASSSVIETNTYDYDLQNKLERVTKTDYAYPPDVYYETTEYTYNDEGIRVKGYYYWTVNSDPTRNDEETKVFLIDSYNPTGYAQVLEETKYDGSMTFVNRTTYTIGDDMVMQSNFNGSTETRHHLLYDGHGSTGLTTGGSVRQLIGLFVNVADTFGYDGYGVRLGGNPNRWSPAQTNLLYAGEYYDNDLQQYNLRARYYDPLNGRFNQVDPYAGNNQDPQSLHKYLYAHANPINNVDPSGRFSISNVMTTMAIGAVLANIGLTVYSGVRHNMSAKTIAWQVIQNLAAFTAIAGAMFLSGPIALMAGGVLMLSFVTSLISVIRNWPGMDTTDKIIMGATFITFLAFAGAMQYAVPPQPSMQGGQTVSQLPESYFSKFTVDMRGAPGSRTNSQGYAVNRTHFWKQVQQARPEYFSAENLAKIQAASPRSPVVDAQWVKYHPQHQSFMGETLVHHHIGQGPIATAVPESIHYSWTSALHPYGGN